MSTDINKNITANVMKDEEKKGTAAVYVPEIKRTQSALRTGYSGDSSFYENSYPSLKKKHSFDSVLTEEFRNILKADQKELKQMLISKMSEYDYEIITGSADDGYIYAKGDIPVMLVAHMDTVHAKKVNEIYVSDCGNITSPQGIGGDDRCGIYMITQLLHKKPYILFTENEELGCLGAKQFAKDYAALNTKLPKANVKYIIELDRKGSNDMVFYSCDNTEFKNYIGIFGWDEKWGSNSDISAVAPAIGAAAVNLSCGYYNAHTTKEIINIDDMAANLVRVARMINKAKEETTPYFKYVHRKVTYPSYYGYYQNYNKRDILFYSKPSMPAAEKAGSEPKVKLSVTDANKKDEDKHKETTLPQKSFKQILNEMINKMSGSKVKV